MATSSISNVNYDFNHQDICLDLDDQWVDDLLFDFSNPSESGTTTSVSVEHGAAKAPITSAYDLQRKRARSPELFPLSLSELQVYEPRAIKSKSSINRVV